MDDKTKKVVNADCLSISSGSTSTTEEIDMESAMDPAIEDCVRDETQKWLALHGPKLFALESSKYLAAESKRKNIRGYR